MGRRRTYWGHWHPIETAPPDQELLLLVSDGTGEPYTLQKPAKLTSDGWVSCSKGTLLVVTPVGWRVAEVPRSPAWVSQRATGP